MSIKPPFPWFGGKSIVAPIVWGRFGNVANYVEPFFGSGAVLFGRPSEPGIETVNDFDGFVSNFWRAVQHDPEQVAQYADWPVNENDLCARHIWLVNQAESFVPKLEGDPDYYDAKIAGWWVWGLCCWIGGGWCSGQGPWHVEDGKLVNKKANAGQGVNRKLPHLGNAGRGVNRKQDGLIEYFTEISERLRNVRVCCGDWSRVCGNGVILGKGVTGVFLDPPYSKKANRDNNLYRVENDRVAHDAFAWAIAHGDDPLMRIAVCGYDGEHAFPASWHCMHWKANGGYAGQGDQQGRKNAHRERIWFSPYCLSADLFDGHIEPCVEITETA